MYKLDSNFYQQKLDSKFVRLELNPYGYTVGIKNFAYNRALCSSEKLWPSLLSCYFVQVWWRNCFKYPFQIFASMELYYLALLKSIQENISKT